MNLSTVVSAVVFSMGFFGGVDEVKAQSGQPWWCTSIMDCPGDPNCAEFSSDCFPQENPCDRPGSQQEWLQCNCPAQPDHPDCAGWMGLVDPADRTRDPYRFAEFRQGPYRIEAPLMLSRHRLFI